MKTCIVCHITKEDINFHRKVKGSVELRNCCKQCSNKRAKARRLLPGHIPCRYPEYQARYYAARKDELRLKAAERRKRRRASDPTYRARLNLRSRLYKALKSAECSRDRNIRNSVGCTILELRAYLESRFLPGMTWENYGQWHLDHIRPLSSFNLENTEEQRQANHYSNLQPLWAGDNIKKGSKYVGR